MALFLYLVPVFMQVQFLFFFLLYYILLLVLGQYFCPAVKGVTMFDQMSGCIKLLFEWNIEH